MRTLLGSVKLGLGACVVIVALAFIVYTWLDFLLVCLESGFIGLLYGMLLFVGAFFIGQVSVAVEDTIKDIRKENRGESADTKSEPGGGA